MLRALGGLLCVALALAGCEPTRGKAAVSASPSPSPAPSVVASTPPERVAFSSRRAMATIEALTAFGPRESAGAAYRKAAEYVARRFARLGYEVERQRFDMPAGMNDRIAVRAGRTYNVVARPRGLRPTDEQVVVGAHLDTTPDSPGANDNASGVAVVIELARMAARTPPRVPTVFVAFAGEERVRQSGNSSVFAEGSREYVRRLSERQEDAVRGMLNIDMVGAGSLRLMGRESSMVRAVQRAARAIDVTARRDTTFFYSDHLTFSLAGIPSAWLWTGDHPSFHSPADRPSVIARSSLRATGRVAWATLRRMRPSA